VRFLTCTLVGPAGNEATKGKSVKVSVVEAREIDYGGKDAIHLRLLTTHTVGNTEQALQIIDWYRCSRLTCLGLEERRDGASIPSLEKRRIQTGEM